MSVNKRTDLDVGAQKEAKRASPNSSCARRPGPGGKEWATIGYAWRRERGEGFSIKLQHDADRQSLERRLETAAALRREDDGDEGP